MGYTYKTYHAYDSLSNVGLLQLSKDRNGDLVDQANQSMSIVFAALHESAGGPGPIDKGLMTLRNHVFGARWHVGGGLPDVTCTAA